MPTTRLCDHTYGKVDHGLLVANSYRRHIMGIIRFIEDESDESFFTYASDSIDWSMRCLETSEIRIVTGAGTNNLL